MGFARSLRNTVDRFGGVNDDEYEGYEEFDESEDEASARSLALVRPPRIEFGLMAPRSFDEMPSISRHLRAGEPVVVDLEGCDAELAARVIDFCSGLTYALEGSLQIVGERTLLLAPPNAELSGEAGAGVGTTRLFNRV
jgi:cell division inhibitor SepF